jgi:hypothetical protein
MIFSEKELKNFFIRRKKEDRKARKNFYKKLVKYFWIEKNLSVDNEPYISILSKRELIEWSFDSIEHLYKFGLDKIWLELMRRRHPEIYNI